MLFNSLTISLFVERNSLYEILFLFLFFSTRVFKYVFWGSTVFSFSIILKSNKKIDNSNEVRTPRVVEWSSSRWTCWVPAGSGLCVHQQLFYEWWEFPMPLTRLIRPCHPKNLSVNHLYPINRVQTGLGDERF